MSKEGEHTKWSTNNAQNKSKYLKIIILYATGLADFFGRLYLDPRLARHYILKCLVRSVFNKSVQKQNKQLPGFDDNKRKSNNELFYITAELLQIEEDRFVWFPESTALWT